MRVACDAGRSVGTYERRVALPRKCTSERTTRCGFRFTGVLHWRPMADTAPEEENA